MSENKNTNSSGIGVCGLLGVAFVILKLCGVIDWSWWWVTAPFWGCFCNCNCINDCNVSDWWYRFWNISNQCQIVQKEKNNHI